tara:strand:- start:20096 stop:20752 length:657 start_codon:yes stop_codon:yes gene_type:complete
MILTIATEKGGSGKTTVSTNLAACFAHAAKTVVLVDADPQESSATWAEMRSADYSELPRVDCEVIRGDGMTRKIRALADRYDVVIVDVAGTDSVDFRQAIGAADGLLVPVRPSFVDAWSVGRMAAIIDDVGDMSRRKIPVLALINAGDTHPNSVENRELKSLLESIEGFTLGKATLKDRKAYKRALGEGLGVIERESADKLATLEINHLMKELLKWRK